MFAADHERYVWMVLHVKLLANQGTFPFAAIDTHEHWPACHNGGSVAELWAHPAGMPAPWEEKLNKEDNMV